MITALKFISRMTNEIFEAQMRRAAGRISRTEHMFHR